jgi:ubiquinone/menaquinone biosynthesis C-methylase UbiE
MLESVKNQYEDFPYPYRDPENEKKRLRRVAFATPRFISHCCFGGENILHKDFRALDAGCGTGDATVHLAEELKGVGATVTAIDFSQASLDITKKRCEVRGLTNVNFICGDLMNLPEMNRGKFDYIVASGVLHHLENPVEGLNVLKSMLKDDGCIAIMVYGKYGRTALYMTQELMRIINQNVTDIKQKIENTKSVIASYPPYHWNKMSLLNDEMQMGNIGIYDMYLHSQDRPYSVKELFNWVEKDCGMHIIHFVSRAKYDASSYMANKDLLKHIKTLSEKDQLSIGELLNGQIFKHSIIVSKIPKNFDYLNKDPHLYIPDVPGLATSNINEKTATIQFKQDGRTGVKIRMTPERIVLLNHINGERTIKEILDEAAKTLGVVKAEDEWKKFAKVLFGWDGLTFAKVEQAVQ